MLSATRTFAPALPPLLVAAALLAAPAGAQTSVERNVGVADRPRLDYDPTGLQVGSFTLYPSARIAADATDNYRASATDTQSEAYLTLSPEVLLRSDWSRHAVQVGANFNRTVHAELPYEDVSTFGGDFAGRLDVSSKTRIRLQANARRAVESRANLGSFRGSRDPVKFDTMATELAVDQEFTKLRLGAAVGISRTDFTDVRDFSGAIVDQDYRDVTTKYVTGNAALTVSPGLSLIVNARRDKLQYDFRPGKTGFDPALLIDRGSVGTTIRGGVAVELSSLILGTIEIGYLERNYRDPRLRDVNGLSFAGNILWNVTPLTSIRMRAARSIEETSSRDTAGNLRNSYALLVDHELLRNMILTAEGSYATVKTIGGGTTGDEFALGLSARYLVNRTLSFDAAIRHSERDSSNAAIRYKANAATLSTRVAF